MLSLREPDDEDGNAKNALLAAIYSPIEQTTCEETIKKTVEKGRVLIRKIEKWDFFCQS